MKKCEFEQLIHSVTKEVYDRGYSISHVGTFLAFCKSIGARFADNESEYNLVSVCDAQVKEAEEKCTYGRVKQKKRFSKYLISYALTGIVDFSATTRLFREDLESEFDSILKGYHRHLQEAGMSKATIAKWEGYAYRFLGYLQEQGLSGVEGINVAVIDEFLCWVAQIHASSGMAGELTMLRSFLGYTDECGKTSSIQHAVPRGRYVRSAPIPALADDEVDRLVAAIDNSKPLGKRDLAIILLALRLGLRSSEIISLKLTDIDWNRSTISVYQVKTKNSICLPLPDDVADAIADYVLKVRPESTHAEVFLKMVPPWNEPIKKGCSLWNTMEKYFVAAGIKEKKEADSARKPTPIGPHRLRHTAATNMLQAGYAPSELAAVLGHTKVENTMLYLSLEEQGLRKCCLDLVGKEASNG